MPGQVTFGTGECEDLCLRSAEDEMRKHDQLHPNAMLLYIHSQQGHLIAASSSASTHGLIGTCEQKHGNSDGLVALG